MSEKDNNEQVSINISGNISVNEKDANSLIQKTKDKTKDTMKDAAEKLKEKEKEIDLLEVSGNIANSLKVGITKLFSFIWRVIKVVLQKLILLIQLGLNSWKYALIVAIILGGAVAFLYKTSEPFYNSDSYGISRITNSQEIIQIINSISIPNDELNIALKNDLNLPPEIYNNIISIKASWLIDENADGIADIVDYDNDYTFDEEKDSLARRMTDRFNVRLSLRNQTITSDIQSALINYLYEHPFIKNLNESRVQTIIEQANIYEQQATVLDSLQTYEYFIEDNIKESNVQSLKFGEFELIGADEQKEKRLYHQDIIALQNSAKSNKITATYQNEPIVFVGSFTNTTQRTNSVIYYGKKIAFIGIPFFLLLFVILKRKEFEEIFNIQAFLEK